MTTIRIGIRVGADGTLRYTVRADETVMLIQDPVADVPISDWPSLYPIRLTPDDTFDMAVGPLVRLT